MALRKRLFAWIYHHLLSSGSLEDPLTHDIRAPLIARARGDVLEIGAGDGGNLALYAPGIRLTLLEPNPYMLSYLREACNGRDYTCISVVEGYGERLPFPEQSFDTVITTHVLCSVSSQQQVLAEIRRVLRPGGMFLFVEHVADAPRTLVYHTQRLINPLWKAVGDGCHLTRDTGAAILAAGFSTVEIVPYKAGWPAIVSPHVYGVATA